MGTVLENSKWKIKVYSPPKEHGAAHVHVIAKGEKAELKVYLETLEVTGKTSFSKNSVRKILKYIHANYDELMSEWEKKHGKNKKA